MRSHTAVRGPGGLVQLPLHLPPCLRHTRPLRHHLMRRVRLLMLVLPLEVVWRRWRSVFSIFASAATALDYTRRRASNSMPASAAPTPGSGMIMLSTNLGCCCGAQLIAFSAKHWLFSFGSIGTIAKP